MAQLNYQVNSNEPEEDFGMLPAGEYVAVIENSDYVANNSGTGMVLKLQYQIIDGPLKNRKLFENLNLEHTNQQAVEISRRALNSIGMAVNVPNITDSSMLHNIPMLVSVGARKNKQTGDNENFIKKHSAVNPTAQTQPAQPAQPASPVATGKQPWQE